MSCPLPTLLAVAVVLACHSAAAHPPAATPPASAIVTMVQGRCAVQISEATGEVAAMPFQVLPSGAVVTTGSDGAVTVGFVSGKRSRLEPGSRARVGENGLEIQRGAISALPDAATLPKILAIAAGAGAGKRPAAIRIRSAGRHELDLNPRDGAASLADATTLRFGEVEGVDRYRVEIEDRGGKPVFAVETRSASLAVPAGILQPNESYYWRVRSLSLDLPVLEEEAAFVTVSREASEARAALVAEIGAHPEPDLILLLAELDAFVGLHHEACIDLEGLPAAQRATAATRLGCSAL